MSHNIIFLFPPSCFFFKQSSQQKNPELNFLGVIPDDTVNIVRVVNKLNQDLFCEKLVEHFYIRWQNNDVFLAT